MTERERERHSRDDRDPRRQNDIDRRTAEASAKRRAFLAASSVAAVSGCLGLGSTDEGGPSAEAENQTTDRDEEDDGDADGDGDTGGNESDADDEVDDEDETASETRIDGVPVERRSYGLEELPYEQRPQFFGPFRRDEPECRHSVAESERVDDLIDATVGDETGHFPLRTSRWLLRLSHCYRETGDEGYLDRAAEMSDAFLEDAVEDENGTPYFAYRLDKGGSSASLEDPWFSGMTQGVALSAYTYLHELTDEDRYLDAAERVFRSFTTLQRNGDGPWTATVDDGYYWIEEYPADPPTHVLNGYLVGLWGVYDYWLHTRSEESRDVLEAALTTIEDHLEYYREPGTFSYYGLDSYYYYGEGDETYSEAYRGNEFYHGVHIAQIRKLYRMTGEEYFREMLETFEEDSPEEAGMD